MAKKSWAPPPLPESVIPKEAFDVGEPEKCGAIDFASGDIEINAGRPAQKIVMVNTGDRPVQIRDARVGVARRDQQCTQPCSTPTHSVRDRTA